jgi:hypothetical protein
VFLSTTTSDLPVILDGRFLVEHLSSPSQSAHQISIVELMAINPPGYQERSKHTRMLFRYINFGTPGSEATRTIDCGMFLYDVTNRSSTCRKIYLSVCTMSVK